MEHRITFEPQDKDKLKDLVDILNDLDFNSIRPMPETLVSDYLDKLYGKPARLLWVAQQVGSFPFTEDIYESSQILINFVAPHLNTSMNEVRMRYDTEVALARSKIRKLPINGDDDALHKYGYQSDDVSYLFEDTKFGTLKPKCQADALLLGKITLNNIINYGSVTTEEWIQKNWGTDNPRTITRLCSEEDVSYIFETEQENTIFPLLSYIIKLLERIKLKITYTYGTKDHTITVVKPYYSKYFTEV